MADVRVRWFGTPELQFNTKPNIVNTFSIRVPAHNKKGWHYYAVPPAVVIVLCSLYNEMKK
jgi:hypothetical protein